MPKRIAPLSDLQVKNAKLKKTAYKLSDGSGLYLLIFRYLLYEALYFAYA